MCVWRERNRLPKTIRDEWDCVSLINLWDRMLMRQRVLLEMIIKQPFPEQEEEAAATIWSEFIAEKGRDVVLQAKEEKHKVAEVEAVDSDDDVDIPTVD